jgi:DNA-binding transcriptional LysR family regulator
MKATTDNLLAWRAFLAVAKTGSISVAARMVDLDPPAVSHMISDIEKELGCQLFNRSCRPFRLTVKGHVLADTVDPLSTGFSNLRDLFTGDTHSVITVAAPTDLNQCYIHDQLYRYSVEHPGVHFYLRASCPVEDVLSGRVDVALIDRPIANSELVIRYCIEALALPMASKGYVEKYGCPNTIEDLKDHTGLLLRQGMHQKTSYLFDSDGNVSPALRWKNVFMTDAQLTLNHMMLEGLGIVVDCVPQHLLKEIESGEVVPVLRGWRRKPQVLSVVTRRDRESQSEALHEFALWWVALEKRQAKERTHYAEELLLNRIRNDA